MDYRPDSHSGRFFTIASLDDMKYFDAHIRCQRDEWHTIEEIEEKLTPKTKRPVKPYWRRDRYD